jgi:PAS domain S-box-containing protein
MSDRLSKLVKIPQISLKWVLIVPFVLQITGAVGLVGYLSYRSGQKAVEQMADRLTRELGDRIDQHLESYLGQAQKINLINREAITSGVLDPNDFNSLGKYFYHQAKNFNFTYVNLGRVDGSFIGAGYAQGVWEIAEILPSDPTTLLGYLVDEKGDRQELYLTENDTKTNQDAWYQDAEKAEKPIWSSIYNWGDIPSEISISASVPVYSNQQQLIGVLGIDLGLNQISQFLTDLKSSEFGHIFILERSGLIVANCGHESSAILKNGIAQRLNALHSNEPLIRDITQFLIKEFNGLENISDEQILRPKILDHPFVKVQPYQDQYGLDWLVIIVIPENEFMGQIKANRHRTLFLSMITLLVASLMGLVTANWITKPIISLSKNSIKLAENNFNPEELPRNNIIQEIRILTQSFQQMSVKMGQSLEESKEKYQTLFQVFPIGIDITDQNGKIIESNAVSEQILGLSSQAQSELEIDASEWKIIRPDGSIMPPEEFASVRALKENRFIHDVEMGIIRPDQTIRWINVSAAPIPLENYGVAIAYMDISDRKQAELETQEIKKFLDSVVENIPNMIFVKDAKNLNFILFNKAGEELLGYSREELIGKNDYDFFPPEEAEFFTSKDRDVLTNNIIFDIPEEPIIAKNRGERILHTQKIPIFDEQGKAKYLLGISEDITERKQSEKSLLESEARFRSLFENSPVAYQSLNEKGEFIDVNDKLCELLGYAREELIGKLFGDFWTEKTKQEFPKAFNYLKCNRCASAELYLVKKDGSKVVVLLEGRVQTDHEGKFIRTHCVIYDITERKYMEDALAESQNLIQTLASNIPGAIYIFVKHPDQSVEFEYISSGCQEVVEIEAEEILEDGSLFINQIHPEDQENYQEAVNFSATTMTPFSHQLRIITLSGKIKWIQANSRPQKRQNGDLVWHGVLLDITDSKLAEIQLEENEQRFQKISVSSPANIYILVQSPDGKIYFEYISAAVEDIHEITAEQAMKDARIILNCTHPDDLLSYQHRVNISAETLTPFHHEWRIITPSGKVKWLQGTSKPELRNNGEIAWYGVVLDISDRKQVEIALAEAKEVAEAATKAKSEFLANMSHEIRTPMNGVLGMTQLLATTQLSEEQRNYLKTIQDSGDSLLTIINDILDFSKIESGKLELEESNFVIEDLVKSISSLLSKQIIDKNLEFEYHLAPDVPFAVRGDAIRLRQIILNLVGNAIKFTQEGRVSINVSRHHFLEQQNHCELLFTIQDTGVGIEKNRLTSLFQAFTQADASISRKYGGTGLGLVISQRLIKMMKGTIWVESFGNIGGKPPAWWSKLANNKFGSTFYFTVHLPISDHEKIERYESENKIIADQSILGQEFPLKILLVEDNAVNQKLAKLMLKKIGYETELANNGIEALQQLSQQKYDLVFMDLQMPEMDGLTATKMIRSNTTLYHQSWIIAMTANALTEDREACLNAGMDDYISKPVRLEKIVAAINHYLTK